MIQLWTGRATFIPLLLLGRNLLPPPTAFLEAILHVNKSNCHSRFNADVQQAFVRTLMKRTMEIDTDLSHEHGFYCVTYDLHMQGTPCVGGTGAWFLSVL